MTEFEKCLKIRELILETVSDLIERLGGREEALAKLRYYDAIERCKTLSRLNDKNLIVPNGGIDPHKLSTGEMKELGFKEARGVMLTPCWLYQFLDPDVLLTAVNGESIKSSDINYGNRGGCYSRQGCLNYGVEIKKEEDK